MSKLIVSATKEEIYPLIKKYNYQYQKTNELLYTSDAVGDIDILIAGIGIPETCFNLSSCLFQRKYDLVINVGLAGAYLRTIDLGEIVEVDREEFADIGLEFPGYFETLFESGLVYENLFPFKDGKLFHLGRNPYTECKNLKKVDGITVNRVAGAEETIMERIEKFGADIETMEGAAFFYICGKLSQASIQIRAISNYVEIRNSDHWRIKPAIINLNNFLMKMLDL